MSIRPQDYESDHPPVRPMGTECEYNQQLAKDSRLNYTDFLNTKTLRTIGINIENSYLGEAYGSGKCYPDVGHLELDTRESMGPASAAVEDLEGIKHLSNIVAATNYPHEGVYRLSGTYIQDGLTEGGVRTSSGRSSGYHESYLFGRYLEHSQAFARLMPTAAACQIWSRGGTLRPEGFVYSQKIWGNGGKPIEHSLSRRTTHGQKPMITVPPASSDADTLGVDEWARAEIRMPDPGLSLVNRFLSFANVSLTLRLVEQSQRLNLNSKRLAELCLSDPIMAAKKYAQDLSLQQAASTISGRQITALDGQEGLLDMFELLAAEVDLPTDERIAIPGIRTVVDALRASEPARAEYTGLAKLRVEFAPKHQFITNSSDQSTVNAYSKVAMHRNIEWSRVLPIGPGLRYWRQVETHDPLTDTVRELAIVAGVSKRSAKRAGIVDNPQGNEHVLNWSHYRDAAGITRLIGSPAGD
jgi:hypothetical protein